MKPWNVRLQEVLNGQILTGEFFRKQYKLILIIVLGLFVYVWLGIRAQRENHHLTQLRKELQDAEYEKQTIHANLTDLTKQSEIARELQERGSAIKENTQPVIAIE